MFFLSVFYRAYSRRITATIPPSITEDTRHTGVYCSGNSYTYCCFSCLFWIAIDWYICFALLAMNLSVGLISGSYLAEVFRGALKLVEPFEITAAKVAGLSRLQIIINIELPQMLRFSVPGIINEFSSVLKATPFAYTVGISEITKQAMSLTAITLNGLQIYTLAALLYFIIYKIFVLLAGFFAKKYRIS